MWPFSRKPTAEVLRGHKKVRIGGFGFTIRKLNPLLDFPPDRMPQVFAASYRENPGKPKKPVENEARRMVDDMMATIEAGVVEPKLTPLKAKNTPPNSITAKDIIYQQDVGARLYVEIVAHSLNRYRGFRGAVFLALTRRVLLMPPRNGTDSGLPTSLSPTGGFL